MKPSLLPWQGPKTPGEGPGQPQATSTGGGGRLTATWSPAALLSPLPAGRQPPRVTSEAGRTHVLAWVLQSCPWRAFQSSSTVSGHNRKTSDRPSAEHVTTPGATSPSPSSLPGRGSPEPTLQTGAWGLEKPPLLGWDRSPGLVSRTRALNCSLNGITSDNTCAGPSGTLLCQAPWGCRVRARAKGRISRRNPRGSPPCGADPTPRPSSSPSRLPEANALASLDRPRAHRPWLQELYKWSQVSHAGSCQGAATPCRLCPVS